MKRTLLLLAMALLAPAAAPSHAAPAQPDPMAGLYGNTLTIAVPAGYYFARRYVDPDGTWWESRGGSEVTRGRWYVEGGQVCSVQTEPAVHDPRRYCYPLAVSHKPGDEWTTIDPDTGNEVIQKIEPGRR